MQRPQGIGAILRQQRNLGGELGADMSRECKHARVECLNPYEFIRKYRCLDCGEVMMCACNENFARRFLPHQLDQAVVLETQERIPVTLGFQARVCRACRGLPEEPHPKAESYGRGSKLLRYYWREIYFETTERFAAWAKAGTHTELARVKGSCPEDYERIRRDVIEEIKLRHATSPKYEYDEESQEEVIQKLGVDVVPLSAEYVPASGRKAQLRRAGDVVSAEEFVARHFEDQGWLVLALESRPIHVLFGVYMFLLVEDLADPRQRMVGFGSRTAFEEGRSGEQILTHLPEDFGSPGYGRRRHQAIEDHLAWLQDDTDELLSLFDYWVDPSERLREYLWAHRPEDVMRAREVVRILPPEVIRRILRYLAEHYWGRYLGWPDLLMHKGNDYQLVEVKSSKDKLSADQKNWIRGNYEALRLPFKLVKIHKQRSLH